MRSLVGQDEIADPGDDAPGWAAVWHVWSVIFPRRAIDGAWVRGRVLRRRDQRRWIYMSIPKAFRENG